MQLPEVIKYFKIIFETCQRIVEPIIFWAIALLNGISLVSRKAEPMSNFLLNHDLAARISPYLSLLHEVMRLDHRHIVIVSGIVYVINYDLQGNYTPLGYSAHNKALINALSAAPNLSISNFIFAAVTL